MLPSPEEADPARRPPRLLLIVLLVLGAIFAAGFAAYITQLFWTLEPGSLAWPDGHPVGADWVNLHVVGALIVGGNASAIYPAADFEAFVTALAGQGVGMRVWAYPPTTLLFAWPVGLLDYYLGLAIWSGLGLAVLALGARAFGFSPLEIAIITFSPAALLNIFFGQTGNIAAGLMLIALAPGVSRRVSPAIAAALLTMKPQIGFLLPVLWLVRRNWRLIAITAALAIALAAASMLAFGIGPWRDYFTSTLPALTGLERHGTGPFMGMIPSAFMSLRILTGNADLALIAHGVIALGVLAILVFRLVRVSEETRQAAMLLAATALISPYLHLYDLALVFCGGLIAARRFTAGRSAFAMGAYAVALWALPLIVVNLYAIGLPLSPLVILPLLFLA